MEDCRIENAFLDMEDSDVELHVEAVTGEKLMLPVHEFILKRASPVFKTMLEPGKFIEGQTRVLKISFAGEANDFLSFLRYVYTKKLENDLDITAYTALAKMAHLYQLGEFRQHCEKNILELLTPFSVCRYFTSLEHVASEEFLNNCKDMMTQSAFLIFMNNLHLSLSETAMNDLLASPELNLLNEDQALGALWKWGHAKCSLENTGGNENVVKKISKLLPLLRWANIKGRNSKDPWFQLAKEYPKYNTYEVGIRAAKKELRLTRFSRVLDIYSYGHYFTMTKIQNTSSWEKLILFSVNQDILLTGIELMVNVGNCNKTLTLDINYEKVSIEIDKMYGVKTNGNSHMCIVLKDFSNPILIEKSDITPINLILRKEDENLEPVTYEVLYLYLPPEEGKGKPEVVFSVHGNVTAIRKIYYILAENGVRSVINQS